MYCHISYQQKKLFNAPPTDLDSTSAMVVLTVELCRDLLRPKHHFLLRKDFALETVFRVSPATMAAPPSTKWREIPMVWKTTERRSLQLSLDDYGDGNATSANTGHDPKFGVGGGGSKGGNRRRDNP
ncbi:hypothetical protein RHSIM_Rhsim01G0237300 [Rhododendron simsii]|uniref:Uncharacterized protein n=1 Tax=Rhododendron simsii TaxID=118357 RepID=A0A834HH68_RHOSS|nr:hypothetical protein RHSIM_Rhsim01G0237300 [Rhododendron simsii]